MPRSSSSGSRGRRADLGFITSTFVYDNVIKHGTGGVSSVGYEQVRFQVKEAKSTAWMHFSGPETA